MRHWVNDLAVGLRLAVGGGRNSLVRFALSTFGIAIAVAVLLLGGSLSTIVAEQQARDTADSVGESVPIPGVDPVYWQPSETEFRGESIEITYVYAEGDNHPVPDGVAELPGPGEMVASPALVELLASPEGELLRPRFPDEIAGVMGKAVVTQPGDLMAYIGADASLTESLDVQKVYQFGLPDAGPMMAVQMLVVVLIGSVVLLLPVFVFVSTASRIAGAERDRRLSALRLVGAGSRQVRRIAAAESVVSALAGLAVGAAVFLVLRQFAEDVELFGLRMYESDVVPNPALVLVIMLAIPGLAVFSALFALRRTIIEPLGVLRQATPVRRRVWWRLVLIVAGVALLFTGGGARQESSGWAFAVTAGAVLLLVGVPVLLPWLVERVAGRIHGGPSSWQLAIRRLQLDSGTSARVVGGVAVVLAGAIALQTILMTVENDIDLPSGAGTREPTIEALAQGAVAEEAAANLEAVPAVRDTHLIRGLVGYVPGKGREFAEHAYMSVMDCAALRDVAGIRNCVDGDVIAFTDMGPVPAPGTTLEFREYGPWYEEPSENYDLIDTWTVPDRIRELPVDPSWGYGSVVVTPGALAGVRAPDERTTVLVRADDPTADELEQIRNAVAGFGWRIYLYSLNMPQDVSADQAAYLAIRNGLYAGSVFTLLLAALSLLVLALEHIRERRRPLAVLAATGVPQGVLARSLLWQVTLPIALGVVVAVLTGVGLAWLVMRISDEPLAIDWLGVGLLSGGAALLSVLVTAMTLPFLRNATRPTSLRTE